MLLWQPQRPDPAHKVKLQGAVGVNNAPAIEMGEVVHSSRLLQLLPHQRKAIWGIQR